MSNIRKYIQNVLQKISWHLTRLRTEWELFEKRKRKQREIIDLFLHFHERPHSCLMAYLKVCVIATDVNLLYKINKFMWFSILFYWWSWLPASSPSKTDNWCPRIKTQIQLIGCKLLTKLFDIHIPCRHPPISITLRL